MEYTAVSKDNMTPLDEVAVKVMDTICQTLELADTYVNFVAKHAETGAVTPDEFRDFLVTVATHEHMADKTRLVPSILFSRFGLGVNILSIELSEVCLPYIDNPRPFYTTQWTIDELIDNWEYLYHEYLINRAYYLLKPDERPFYWGAGELLKSKDLNRTIMSTCSASEVDKQIPIQLSVLAKF